MRYMFDTIDAEPLEIYGPVGTHGHLIIDYLQLILVLTFWFFIHTMFQETMCSSIDDSKLAMTGGGAEDVPWLFVTPLESCKVNHTV